MLPELITFDLGGTLIAPSPTVGETYAEVIRAHGFEANSGRLNRRFPPAMKRWTHALGPRLSPRDERGIWASIVRETVAQEGVPESAFDAIFADLFEAYASGERWQVLADVRPVLANLKNRGLRLAVISNSDSRMRRVLSDLQLDDLFEALFLSGEIGYEKPDIRLFEHVMRSLEVTPKQILHVGDSSRHDHNGAQAAGWRSFLFEPGIRTLAMLPDAL